MGHVPLANICRTEATCPFLTALAFLSCLAEMGILALAFMACGFAVIVLEEV